MKKLILSILALLYLIPISIAQKTETSDFKVLPFGEAGQIKMYT